MRKLAFLSVLVLGNFLGGGAWATCGWEFGSYSSNANEYIYKTSDQKHRVECDSSKCTHGTYFYAPSGHKFEGNVYNKAVLYRCAIERTGDLWVAMDKSDFHLCPGYYQTSCSSWRYMDESSGTVTEVSGSGGMIMVNDQSDICYYCEGDVPVNSNCMDSGGALHRTGDTINIKCTETELPISSELGSTDNLANDAQCYGTCESDGWDILLRDESCAEGFGPDEDRKNCVETAESEEQRKCVESGGVYAENKCTCDAAKNLREDAGECKCLDDVNYHRSADGKSCDLTDAAALQRKCEAAAGAGAVWDGAKCICSDLKKIWNGTTCVANPNIAKCEAITDAKWSNGKCVCIDPDKEINDDGTACVESVAARARRDKARRQAEQAASVSRIKTIREKIDDASSSLGVSVWKNREGKFNTSRLASDSIAGVVLGTAGGLITSHVIKKNQIKGGFEDINCTIGGQVVAGYGDEFNVGIQ